MFSEKRTHSQRISAICFPALYPRNSAPEHKLDVTYAKNTKTVRIHHPCLYDFMIYASVYGL